MVRKIPHAWATTPVPHDYWVRTLDACHVSWARVLPTNRSLPCRETVLHSKRSLQWEAWNTTSKSGHHSLQLEKAFTKQQRSSTVKNKEVKKKFFKNKNRISKNSFKKVHPWSPTQPNLLAGHCDLYKPTRQGWCGLTGEKINGLLTNTEV